ncbi:Ig-like domain-containing protein [Pontiellaceae bacterium B12227]|nr:Ig-like domain-containing protein [Pontiellaceae bacterium B12227]
MINNRSLLLISTLILSALAHGAGYNPDIWLDASDASTIQFSGGLVQQWNDKSGNGNHAIAPASTNRPTYDSVKGSIEFDGIDDGLRITGGSECGPNDEITVFVVAQLDDTSKTQSILTDVEWTTFSKRFAVHYWNVSYGGYMALYGDGRTEHGNRDYDLHLTSFRYDGSTLHSGMDGLTPPLQEALSQDTSGTSDLMLGNATTFDRNALDGRICEVIIYKKALTALQVQTIEFELRNKWGFVMDPTHPFYSDDFGVEFGQSFSIAENAANGTTIGTPVALSTNATFVASDWRIEPVGSLDKTVDIGAFGIDPVSGEIFVADSSKLDFEQFTTHRIAISVSDGTSRSPGVEVDIDVINVADGDPARTNSSLWGVNGELWNSYSRLPDWSHAGYHWGEDPIPDHADWPVYDITDYGAIVNDGNDDSAAIQAAVNAASTAGAIVYMPSGQFLLENMVSINRGNLILRGAGRDAGGTVLYCPIPQKDFGDSTLNDHMIEFEGNNGNYNTFNSKTVAAEAKRGDRTLLLTSAPSWQPGQKVHLGLTEEGPDLQGSLWLHLHNNQADFNPDPSPWCGGSGTWPYTVERVSGKLVTFREPLRCDVRLVWQPKVFERKGMSEVGAEDFKMEFPDTPVPEHLQEDGYNGIHFKYVEHGWIRRMEFENADNPVAFGRCSNSNMEDLLFTGRAAHHGPTADYDGNNLIRNIVFDQTNSFVHSITFTHKATGNVACDLSGTATITLDLHGNCPMENLFTGVTTAWGDGSSGTAGSQPHGAHGNTYWNLTGSNTFEPGNYKYIGTSIIGPTALPDSHTVTRDWTENITSVSPANIYDAQLSRRLNPPADPAFASGAFGERSNWFERDPARWRVSNGAEPAYEILFGETPAVPGDRLSTYSIYTNTPETEIEMRVQTLEDLFWQPGADVALVLGYQDDENYLYTSVSATNGAQIIRVQNGSGSVLASDSAILLASNDWKTISFARADNTVELIYDGQSLQATDSIFTSGHAGIGSNLGKAAFKETAVINTPPVAYAQSTNTLEDISVNLVLTGFDAEGSNLTFTVESLPTFGTLTGSAPNLAYAPGADYFGADLFTFTVSDGSATSAAATVSITINPVNDDPVFSADPIIGSHATQDVAYAGSIAATDVDGNSLSYSLTSIPTWLTVSTNGVLGGMPSSGDVGLNSFTIEVDDGNGGTDVATLQIVVRGTTTQIAVDYLEFDASATNSWSAPGTASQAIRPVGYPGSNRVWNVGETVILECDVQVVASTDPIDYNSSAMSLGFGLGDNAQAICWGIKHQADSYQFANSSIDSSAGSAGSMSANLYSSGDRVRYTGIEGTAYDLYDNNETAHMILSATYKGGTEYDLAWTVQNTAVPANSFTMAVTRDEGVKIDFIDEFHIRRNLSSGTADYTFSNVVIKVERETTVVVVDTDGDGLTDAQEIALGTDPYDPNSGFGIDGLPLPITGKIEITWPSATGVLYRIWESPDLASWVVARNWTNALTPPEDTLELDLTPSNGFFKVEAEIQ